MGTARRASRLARDSSVGMQVTLDVQKVDAVFFLYCATLVFAMQIGFTLLEVGSVSIKNTKNVLIKNLVDLCVSGLAFYTLGFGLMHGSGGGFAGANGFAMVGGRYSSSSTEAARWHAEAFFFVGVRVDVDDHRVRCGGGEVFVSSVRACGGTDVGIDFSDRRALGVDRFGVVIAVVSRTVLGRGRLRFRRLGRRPRGRRM